MPKDEHRPSRDSASPSVEQRGPRQGVSARRRVLCDAAQGALPFTPFSGLLPGFAGDSAHSEGRGLAEPFTP